MVVVTSAVLKKSWCDRLDEEPEPVPQVLLVP